MLKNLSFVLRTLFLRGPLRRWWIIRRARQTDTAYLASITKPQSAVIITKPPALIRISPLLNRILFIGDCMWEQEQLFPEICKICELEVLDLRQSLTHATDPAQAVVSAIRKYAASSIGRDPDLILFYARPSLLSAEVFSLIRSRWSCPLLGMNLDDRVEFFPHGILKSGNDNYARWIQSFDINLTSSLAAMDWYRERGAEVRYFPQGFCPDSRFAAPPSDLNFRHSFSFVGSWKPERGNLIEQLREYGITPEIFGKGWQDGQWIEDPATVFRGSQLNLGIGYALASARIANAKGRDIECPATGACYLTTYHWELAEMFEIGKEVLCYRNVEELIELYSYYSKRPDACLAIARAAHKRAHSEHTWELRLRGLFNELNFHPSQ